MKDAMPPLSDQVRAYVEGIVGEEGLRVLDYLDGREEATDTEIAETLEEKPSHVRKVLYELYAARVAEYHKEKDKETGWLTFYWQLTPEEAEQAITAEREEFIAALEEKLRFEEGHDFYTCPDGPERYDFEDAYELEFRCPVHDVQLEHVEENENIRILTAQIEALRRDEELGKS